VVDDWKDWEERVAGRQQVDGETGAVLGRELRRRAFVLVLFCTVFLALRHVPVVLFNFGDNQSLRMTGDQAMVGMMVPDSVRDSGAAAAAATAAGAGLDVHTMLNYFDTQNIGLMHVGISPYITASIMIRGVITIYAPLRMWSKVGAAEAREEIDNFTRELTLVVAIMESIFHAWMLSPYFVPTNAYLSSLHGHKLITYLAIFFVLGSVICVWISDVIQEYGLGPGTGVLISLNILAAYAAQIRRGVLPMLAAATLPMSEVAIVVGIFVVFICGAVLITEGQYKVPIRYFKSQARIPGTPESPQDREFVPFRINPSGMQSILFAVVFLEGPKWLAKTFGFNDIYWVLSTYVCESHPFYYFAMFILVWFFLVLDWENLPLEISDYLTQMRASVKNVRPGSATQRYLWKIQTRARMWGGLLTACLAVSAELVDYFLAQRIGTKLGITSVLIVVGTVLQIRRQVRALTEVPDLDRSIATIT